MRVTLILVALLACAVSANAQTNRYVTADGAGDFSGTSWSTACNGFTGACLSGTFTPPSTFVFGSLVRGDTYYVADGDYTSDGLVLFYEQISGTTRVTIKKATVADHGTSTGWSDTMGDGQAIFDRWYIGNSYWTFNGQVGEIIAGDVDNNGDGIDIITPFGFLIDNQLCSLAAPATTTTAAIKADAIGNITLQFFEIAQCGQDLLWDGTVWTEPRPGYGDTTLQCSPDASPPGVGRPCGFFTDGVNASQGLDNLIISDAYIHDLTRNAILTNNQDNVLYERVTLARLHGIDGLNGHSQPMSFTGGPMENITIRYCLFVDGEGSGAISLQAIGSPDTFTDVFIYGNLLFNSGLLPPSAPDGGTYTFSPGAIWSRSENTLTNVLIYNNTFYNIYNPETHWNDATVVSAENVNNVYVNSVWSTNPTDPAGFTKAYNYYYNNSTTGSGVLPTGETGQQNGTQDIFTNAAEFDFTLSIDTTTGATLSSPYDEDMFGTSRVAGSWSRGTFQFGTDPPAVPVGLIRVRVKPPEDWQ